jgi:membrane fusion protein (multidrug efflux system)
MSHAFAQTTRSLQQDQGVSALLIWTLCAALLAGWMAWLVMGRVTLFQVSQAAKVEASQSSRPAAALVSGRVVAAPVVMGQQVRAGDVLFELDAGQQRLAVEEAAVKASSLPSRIAALEAEIAELAAARKAEQSSAEQAAKSAVFRAQEARARAEFAAENARKLEEEARNGAVSRLEAQRAQSQAQELAASHQALVADAHRLQSEVLSRQHANEAQIEARQRELLSLRNEQAASGVASARLTDNVDRQRIRAPIDGRIGDLAPLKVGAYVAEGQTVASVVPGGALMLVAQFDPASVQGRIRPGQKASVALEGYPWTQYGQIGAVVRSVATDIRDGHLRVELDPSDTPNARRLLKHGLVARVEVEVEQIAPAELVLRSIVGRRDVH